MVGSGTRALEDFFLFSSLLLVVSIDVSYPDSSIRDSLALPKPWAVGVELQNENGTRI